MVPLLLRSAQGHASGVSSRTLDFLVRHAANV